MQDKYRKATPLSLAIITAVLLISLNIFPPKAIAQTAEIADTTISKADHEAMLLKVQTYYENAMKSALVIVSILFGTLAVFIGVIPTILEIVRFRSNKKNLDDFKSELQSYLENLETQLQSYSRDQAEKAQKKSDKALSSSLKLITEGFTALEENINLKTKEVHQELSDDINNKTETINIRIDENKAGQSIDNAFLHTQGNDFFNALLSYLSALDYFTIAGSLGYFGHWLGVAINTANTVISKNETFGKEVYRILHDRFLGIDKALKRTDQYDKFSSQLLVLSGLINELKKQIRSDDLD